MAEQERIDISEHVKAICGAFGFESENVARIDIRPSVASVEVYRLNDDGSKFIDLATWKAAMDEHSFKVIT